MLRSATLTPLSLILSVCFALPSFGTPTNNLPNSSMRFHQYLYSILQQPLPEVQGQDNEFIHYVLDQPLATMLASQTDIEAANLVKTSSLSLLQDATLDSVRQAERSKVDPRSFLGKAPITIVVVPGIFGEFIPNQPFAEIFEKPSPSRTQFLSLLKTSTDKSLTMDESLQIETSLVVPMPVPLEDVIHVGSIMDGQGVELVRIVNLFTPAYSLETLGTDEAKAVIFNRRLEKYIRIMKDENLVLLGYSRGTPFALEMVAQAYKQKNFSYLSKVRGLVSYAGVIFGSTLADLTLQEGEDNFVLFKNLRALLAELRTAQNAFDLPLVRTQDSAALLKFGEAMAPQSQTAGSAMAALNDQLESLKKSDLLTESVMVQTAAKKLGLDKDSTFDFVQFNKQVNAFKLVIQQVMLGAGQLRTPERTTWWKMAELPKQFTYYSLSAAMANGNNSDFEKTILNKGIGYSGSLDDNFLAKNQQSYQDKTGIKLNDSQVTVAQSSFIPGWIKTLNPKNRDLKTDHLGILGTHHWGITLQTVNQENPKKVNPFPREAVLTTLAAVIAEDILTAGSSK